MDGRGTTLTRSPAAHDERMAPRAEKRREERRSIDNSRVIEHSESAPHGAARLGA